MSEKFVIEGGRVLEGEIEVRGSKNAAGALIAAALLTDEEIILENIPLVSDILNLLEILKGMGAEIEWLEERKVKIKSGGNINPEKIDFERVSKSRVSVLLIGALLPRFTEFKISRPGGDRIGVRPITTHLQVLQELGSEIVREGDFYYFKRNKLVGKEIILPEFSVTATENLMMASCLAEGETIIKGAAQEPQVQDLGKLLEKMGAKIEGIGTHTLRIQGVKKLKGAEHKIIPDHLEGGSFVAIGAGNRGRVLVKKLNPEHLDLFLVKLKEIGVEFKRNKDSIEVWGKSEFKPARIQALPYPGFPTDLLPLVVPLLTQAKGKSLIHDPLYENRLNYTQELKKMGADIEVSDPHRAFIFGKTPLQGVTIESWDIRAGASLVLAGLMAQGVTTIKNIEQIDRGYEKLEERLQRLGAEIKRASA
ncbi:MAG: UDP-N-acetylglucosamine 1-carboxyvinyltransferase [Candidatus Nealsonbacteria bacterium]|nr:MAG: UDP-N-acetylglucosamine 1-carboxyvinyltransferase [Candidatus Nealsonbacteria bacterium]